MQITFDRPVLPAFLDEVVLRNLVLGEAVMDLALRRSGGHVVVDVLGRKGAVRILTTS
jgi:hypothetical protein